MSKINSVNVNLFPLVCLIGGIFLIWQGNPFGWILVGLAVFSQAASV